MKINIRTAVFGAFFVWIFVATCYAQDSAGISAKQVSEHIGSIATVCSLAVNTNYALSSRRQPTFLNLDRAYPSHVFTAVIWGRNRIRFNEVSEQRYQNKNICVNGLITIYLGRPQIFVRSPQQITIQE